jgi:hypothetical protein
MVVALRGGSDTCRALLASGCEKMEMKSEGHVEFIDDH